ncbi:MAG: division/cell wall cluster transcriptional repressor MraZ [Thermodesulfovibrionales bacterium]|nr:division/cell wall cluster transcriptional repressor MraZ [Thermodesulfovibrionales bacterium]
MQSFTGTYYYTIDQKGRVIIPVPLRELLLTKYNNTKIFITNAPFDKCLHVFPLAEWSVLEEKLKDKPKTDRSIQFFIRRVFASAVECDIDKQGRLMIPYELRQNASLTGDIAIVGAFDRLEIWDRAKWEETINPDNIDIDAYNRSLVEHGF